VLVVRLGKGHHGGGRGRAAARLALRARCHDACSGCPCSGARPQLWPRAAQLPGAKRADHSSRVRD
jgi:hypothetical protein